MTCFLDLSTEKNIKEMAAHSQWACSFFFILWSVNTIPTNESKNAGA
jgi:hypothetical protein